MTFEEWQQAECKQLDCTVEEHNKILEIANKYASLGLSSSAGVYYDLKLAIGYNPTVFYEVPAMPSYRELQANITHRAIVQKALDRINQHARGWV